MQRDSHFSDLDGMRGVLAVVVMLHHYGLNSIVNAFTQGLISQGVWALSVDFFFILSGFVLALSFSRGRPSLVKFANKRIRRLAPAFLLTTIWMAALPGVETTVFSLAMNLAIIQSIVGGQSINGPGWSVPFELYLPMLALLAWSVFERRPRWILAISLVVGCVGALWLAQGHDVVWLRAIAGLAAGFSLFQCGFATPAALDARWAVLGLFVLCIAIMLLAGLFAPLAVLFPAVAATTILAGTKGGTILSTPPFQALGRWSFGIYLVHVPIMTTAFATLGASYFEGNVLGKMGLVVATFVASALLYRYIERPLMWVRPPTAG